jgi:hypothetical protein
MLRRVDALNGAALAALGGTFFDGLLGDFLAMCVTP